MKISYNWLLDYLPEAYHRTPEQLSEILTNTGLEVEGVERIDSVPGGLEGIVIGEVKSCVKHPNADKLKCTIVSIGNEELPIVCGAPNVAAGQKVLVATVGSTIHPTNGEPFTIKKAKIRGELSQGMICAEDELSLGESHDGILVLPENAPVGQKAAKYYQVSTDYQIEIGLTPNRTDAMGHWGVARDIVAALNCIENKKEKLKIGHRSIELQEGNCPVEILVEDAERCPRYAGLVIKNLKLDASPNWLQNRLKAIGLKPINNLVDITNYVCHGLGHPMHAFDLAQVANNKVIVKTLATGSSFTTLDKLERKLDEKDLMICNASAPMCIAGVFGGLQSGVSENTKAIFLESAYFNPVSIRKTAKRHGLNTDASFRYERGIDPNATIEALKHAAALYQEIAGGEISGGYSDVKSNLISKFQVEFDPQKFTQLAGIEIPESKIDGILADLDIKISSKSAEQWKLEVPAYRADVTRHADICEEILRIYGFNEVPIPGKISLSPGKRQNPSKHAVREQLSALLCARGLSEGMSNGLSNTQYLQQLPQLEKQSIQLLNPLSSDLGILRSSMLFSALDCVKHNQKYGQERVAIFEFGKQYFKTEKGYGELEELSLLLVGNAQSEGWSNTQEKMAWNHIKTLVDLILERSGVTSGTKIKAGKESWMEYGMQIQFKNQSLANWGKINAKLLKQNDIKQEVYFAHINFELLFEIFSRHSVKLKELPKFPGSRRDLSLLLNSEVEYESLEKAAKKAASQMLQEVSLFDVYEGKNLPNGKKSYALSFQFHAGDRNLTDEEVDREMQQIQNTLEKEFNATLR
ncbi:MAG: phenylalanine--tRNA ligase subunit beta [Luteibaculum sp.]